MAVPATARDKRRHIRLEHRGIVEFVSGGQTFQGTTINISRNGMQVVVNLPDSHDSIRSITFQLPGSGDKIPIPCRLVRSSGNGKGGEKVLGIEFQYEAEAQLLLIEKFMQDSVCRASDFRQIPRTACRLQNVEIDRPGVKVRSIDNLSTDGGLISFRGALQPHDQVTLLITMHDDSRQLCLAGEVVYVLKKALKRESAAGIRFCGLRVSESARLRNLIIACCSGSGLSEIHQLFRTRPTSSEHRISGGKAIAHILSELRFWQVPLSLLVEGSLYIQERPIDGLQPKERRFTVCLPTNGGMPSLQKGTPCLSAYFAFFWKGSNHYFKAGVTSITSDKLELLFPKAIYRSDKRSYERKTLEFSTAVQVFPDPSDGSRRSNDGVLRDISRRGFLCEIPLVSDWKKSFAPGRSLRYAIDQRLGLGTEGQVRHVKQVSTARGEVLQLGIEAGVARKKCQFSIIAPEAWNSDRPDAQVQQKMAGQKLETVPIMFRDKAGHIIRGSVNMTHPGALAPVVIIPPSYGKRKEAFAPLAATLLANAWAQGKPLAVLRFDGVNRPGESHNDVLHPRMGYEMLSYRISQGLADLQAALEYVRHNDLFTAERTILITLSMSSLDARKLLSQNPKHGVDFWISCMGAPCAQATMRNLLGGIDIVSNARMGISNGLMGMLGHLINMDILGPDVLDRKYAFLTDARFDMAKISIPVLWISGQYDRWVEKTEVRDLMSVRAEAGRELVEIPSGHNLRTSDDAIRAFKLIAASIHQQLYGKRIEPCDPNKEELVRLISAERERLTNANPPPPMVDYWRGYLVGNERNRAGYDFYRNIEEFAEFLIEETQLLELKDRETIADLGCGTGIFLEALLRHLVRGKKIPLGYDVQAFDLVPEAIEKARTKCKTILDAKPSLCNVRISFRQEDLEPNRLLPVARLLESPQAGLESLRDKIEGLSGSALDRLQALVLPELEELLLSSTSQVDLASRFPGLLGEEEQNVVIDLNLAARFLRQRLTQADLKSPQEIGRLDYQTLRTSDLAFRTLDFKSCGNQLSARFADRRYTTIVASLFISYLFNPQYLLEQCFQALAPGGRLLVSSMRPDSDISVMFINYIQGLQRAEWHLLHEKDREENLSGAREMLNEAASLFELEESGFFRFYTASELRAMLHAAGFERVTVGPAMGNPAQAFIALGFKL